MSLQLVHCLPLPQTSAKLTCLHMLCASSQENSLTDMLIHAQKLLFFARFTAFCFVLILFQKSVVHFSSKPHILFYYT